MKRDPYKHKERYLKWKEKSKYGIREISKYNSDLLLQYLNDMEKGVNISRINKKGSRSYIRLNNLKQRMIFLAKEFEKRFKLNKITDIKEDTLFHFCADINQGIIKRKDGKEYRSAKDFVKTFKAFWHWYQKVQRKQGKNILDITIDLDSSGPKPEWVYLNEEQIKLLCENAKYDYRVLIMFLFEPSKENHFAMFPSTLPEFCVKAGCPIEVCKKCGTPKLTRKVGGSPYSFNIRVRDAKKGKIKYHDRKASNKEIKHYQEKSFSKEKTEIVFSCDCNAGFKPGIVLDPFMGSGTTAIVAKKLGMNFIGFELNKDYIKISNRRLAKIGN